MNALPHGKFKVRHAGCTQWIGPQADDTPSFRRSSQTSWQFSSVKNGIGI